MTLFATFAGLLATVIGDRLAWSLLREIWPDTLAGDRTPGGRGMTERRGGVPIRKLATGVPGLDDVLGGGLPELSFNLIVGGPGSGKTTLAHQIMFANATAERPGLYFTVLGEPPLKMLRYQQQYSFFDPAKVNGTIRFVSLSARAASRASRRCSTASCVRSRPPRPGFVVVDSFRSVMRVNGEAGDRRAGVAGLRPAAGAAPHRLGGDDLPDRRVRRAGGSGPSGLHRRRRPHRAEPEDRAQLRRAEAAGS